MMVIRKIVLERLAHTKRERERCEPQRELDNKWITYMISRYLESRGRERMGEEKDDDMATSRRTHDM